MNYPIRNVSVNDQVRDALAYGSNAVVAIGVSGGKDSSAVAIATVEYLKSIEFQGEVVLIHADLGMTEWSQSLPKCQELAKHLELELIVVQRNAGGMMERWEGRWEANLKRYVNLECVKLILPWSTASMRFCTSELKTAPICGELKKRYKGKMIINAIGIRREESKSRAAAPVSKANARLAHKTVSKETGIATRGIDWNPIIEWRLLDVLHSINSAGQELHEAYTKFGMSRVSCAFCILSSKCDIQNASRASENHDLFRRQVELEIRSTFSFQSRWLADSNKDLLDDDTKHRLAVAKVNAQRRITLEDMIPKRLHYVKGWPTFVPDLDDAQLIADVRIGIGKILGVDVKYTTPESIRERYQELMELKGAKEKKKAA